MKTHGWIVALLGIAALVVACGGRTKAPTLDGTKKIRLQIVVDYGVDQEGLNERQIKQRTQVGTWMSNDIVKVANKVGFEAELIQNRDAYRYAEGVYLLVTKITNYNPGSKAARMVVGMGAGAASLTVQAEMYGEGDTPMWADALASGSGRDWNYCARACNEQAVKRAATELNAIHVPAE